jgi:hypothetical protein
VGAVCGMRNCRAYRAGQEANEKAPPAQQHVITRTVSAHRRTASMAKHSIERGRLHDCKKDQDGSIFSRWTDQ